MRHFLNILVLFWTCLSLLGCGRPRNDVLLKNHLGSLDQSKATRIEVDFARLDPSKHWTKDWTAWFYIEAPGQIISAVLLTEGFSPDDNEEVRVITRISASAKMARLPAQQDCIFYHKSAEDECVSYHAITNKEKDRLWIVAQKY